MMDKKASGLSGAIKLLFSGPGKYATLPLALGAASGLGAYAAGGSKLPEHLRTEQSKYNQRKGGWTIGGGIAGAGLGAGIGSALKGTKAGLIAGLAGGFGGALLGASHAGKRERKKLEENDVLRATQRTYPIKF
jgi:hypothetical protein